MKIPLHLQLLPALHVGASGVTYDYMIAGAGTAGLVLANRLSANPSITVAVIEPGNDVRNNSIVNSIEDASIVFDPTTDWAYNSTAQPQLGNRTLLYHAGKAIGGTSTINGMVYIRGDEIEIDDWASLGDEGWTWDFLFPYYLLSENFTIPTSAQLTAGASFNPSYHGESGFLKTGFPFELDNSSFHSIVQQSFAGLGLPLNQDLNEGNTRGFSIFPQTLDRDADVRETSARAYYEPVENRPNLQIIKGTVNKIIWSGEKCDDELVASGVEYFDADGNAVNLTARKEVILSAGTYRSPLILELSGVGNPNILATHEIETQLSLPGVGEGLQDQCLIALEYLSSTNITGLNPFAAFANIHDLRPALLIHPNALEKRFQVQHDAIFTHNATMLEMSFFASSTIVGIVTWPLLPFSWGSVHLSSPSTPNEPVIDPNFLSIPFDMQALIAGGRLGQEVFSTPPLSNLIVSEIAPGLAQNASDEDWEAYVQDAGTPVWHGVGTCAMLPRELGGVVDAELKLYGTANVRVVDASVLPTQMSGHPTATIYALAERAARIILGEGDVE